MKRAAIIGAGPVGLLRRRPAAEGGLRGRPLRPAADAVRARARRRGARPSQDQVGHARLRQDRRPRGVSLLRRRRARAATSPARSCWQRYHAVVYAVGTATDNRLGIPGEDRPGSHAATEFVAWYNGHPYFTDHEFDLNGGRAVVVGNGNVAIDVARMLVLDPGELAPTDTADHALDAFGMAGVTEVVLLGRRGPARGVVHQPRAARARRARARRRDRRSRASSRASPEPEDADPPAQRRDPARVRAARRRPASRTGSSCASCARRSRSSARARMAR